MSERHSGMTDGHAARPAPGSATPRRAVTVYPSRLVRSAALGLVLLATACSTAGAQGTRAECEAAGGTWGRFGLRQQELCDLPAPDAGKACTDSKECASACIAPDSAPVGSASPGQCYGRMLLLGTCLKQLHAGVVTAPLCAD